MTKQELLSQRDYCTHMLQSCTDAIKLLAAGYPEGFKMTISHSGVSIFTFDILEADGNFTLSFFMSWHAYYDKRLATIIHELQYIDLIADISLQ